MPLLNGFVLFYVTSPYISQVAQQESLQSRWDNGNLIISRPSAGAFHGEPIIIQTHVDRVYFSYFSVLQPRATCVFHSLVVIQPNQHAANQQLMLMGILQLQCLMAGFPFHYERVVQEQRTSTWLVIIYFEVLEVQGSTQLFFQDVLNLMSLEVFQQW